MIFKRYEWRLLLRIVFLFITLMVTAMILVRDTTLYMYLAITIPLLIYEVIDLIRFQKKAQDEISQFVESIHYRDFSRHFDVRKAPNELKPLRKGGGEGGAAGGRRSRE